ncbi:MAG: 1-acyl-sn-glycerol-3-phosphate acyltransferase [Pseudomonadota bacterium]
MKDRIDPLIQERAPWLARGSLMARIATPALHKMLCYNRTISLAQDFRDRSAQDIMSRMRNLLAHRVTVQGRWNVPARGAAMIVANHPTGIADALMLSAVLAPIRDDAYYFANSDILRVLPQMADVINPVEWRPEKRSRESLRATMTYTRSAVDDGRLGVIFPSGRLAKRVGMSLKERPWMTSAAMIARKFDLPIIPVNIQARNSAIFYLFDFLHPTLRDITLFYETLNKVDTPFHITIGKPIAAQALPPTSEAATDILFDTTMALAPEQEKGAFPLLSRREKQSWNSYASLA